MLILGAQILLGFQLRVVFEPAFEKLPRSSQFLKMAAIVILLAGIAMIMSPGSYHRIVRSGNDAEDVQQFATSIMDFALVPFLLALAIDLYVSAGRLLGFTGGLIGGTSVGAAAFALWYVLGWAFKSERRKAEPKTSAPREERTSLKDKIDQTLTEARVVLPGAQALLGFQLVTLFTDEFDKLPNSSKYIHLASLGLMALTMVFLMTPAAFHRIAERGEVSATVNSVASTFLIMAMVTLPLGITGDVFVIFLKVTNSMRVAVIVAGSVLIFFYALWFGVTSYWRAKLRS